MVKEDYLIHQALVLKTTTLLLSPMDWTCSVTESTLRCACWHTHRRMSLFALSYNLFLAGFAIILTWQAEFNLRNRNLYLTRQSPYVGLIHLSSAKTEADVWLLTKHNVTRSWYHQLIWQQNPVHYEQRKRFYIYQWLHPGTKQSPWVPSMLDMYALIWNTLN